MGEGGKDSLPTRFLRGSADPAWEVGLGSSLPFLKALSRTAAPGREGKGVSIPGALGTGFK